MDFGLNEEQELLQAMVQSALVRACSPAAVRAAWEAGQPVSSWDVLIEAGLPGMLVPAEQGGVGLGLVEAALVSECLGASLAGAGFIGHAVAARLLAECGSDEVRTLVAQAATGSLRLALALPGLEVGGELRLTLQDQRATGSCGPFASLPEPHIVVSVAPQGEVFVVDRRNGEVDLVPVPSGDQSVSLRTVRVNKQPVMVVGRPPQAVARAQAAARVLHAADALGASQAAFDRTLDYLGARKQFGSPLSGFQAIRHELADIAATLESCRSLVWYAAALHDEDGHDSARIAAIAKAHVCEQALQTVRQCVVLHGAIGFAWECDIHFWLKRVLTDAMLFGSIRELRLTNSPMHAVSADGLEAAA